MKEIVRIGSIAQYNNIRGVKTEHPLVAVIDLAKAQPMPAKSFNFGLYAVSLKEGDNGQLRYGRSHYDYQAGSMIFVAPGQVIAVEPAVEPGTGKGWILIFHPDLINGTPLGKHIQNYSFFSYDVHEALHLSDKEQAIVTDCFAKIEYELDQNLDKHSKVLIASNIELLLNYCTRFYDRQFIIRENANRGVLERFERLLKDYFSSDQPQLVGFPSVAYCARALHLSSNYFGDLIKKETSRSAQEYIQSKVLDIAKERLLDVDKSVSEIAYELGFKYPQNFTRLFKQKTGTTPNDYRMLN